MSTNALTIMVAVSIIVKISLGHMSVAVVMDTNWKEISTTVQVTNMLMHNFYNLLIVKSLLFFLNNCHSTDNTYIAINAQSSLPTH